ncbi:MAG: DUF4388 domain-containing protein, partial [Planctomycetota bacterium]
PVDEKASKKQNTPPLNNPSPPPPQNYIPSGNPMMGNTSGQIPIPPYPSQPGYSHPPSNQTDYIYPPSNIPFPTQEQFGWNAPPQSYPSNAPHAPQYPQTNLNPYSEGWYEFQPPASYSEYPLPVLPRYALVSNEFSPIYLNPGQYTIGREQNNSIVLSDVAVSKLHTVLTVDLYGQVFIEDQGSKNKTLVNGIPIEGVVPLQLGSKITIGKFNIFYKDLNTAQLRKIPKTFLNHETVTLKYDGKNAMIGSLSSMSITELFTTLESNQKTGILTVTDGVNEGRVFFREGKVIRCEFRGILNMNCIYKILKLKEGGFEFASKELNRMPDEIPLTTQQILFEFARNMDERR